MRRKMQVMAARWPRVVQRIRTLVAGLRYIGCPTMRALASQVLGVELGPPRAPLAAPPAQAFDPVLRSVRTMLAALPA